MYPASLGGASLSNTEGWHKRAGSPFNCRKSPLIASEAVVASNHPLASLAGVEMFARGGNIFDAAIATAFALTVVEPMMVGIFGGGTIVARTVDGEITVIDNLSTAPRAATPGMYRPDDSSSAENPAIDRENDVGYRAVGVPGTLPAWCELLASRGRLTLGEVMAPAIRLAADGFRASSFLVQCITEPRADLARFPATAEIFLPGGEAPKVGDTIVRRDYARSLESIARDGVKVLHDGPLGETICADMARNGGILTMDDLRGYEIAHRQPIRGTYRGHEILSMAPASSGGTFIVQGLNILEGFDLRSLGFGTPESTHLIAETLKLGFADRQRYMSDPAFVEMPIEALIDPGYAEQRRGLIDCARAGQPGAGMPAIRSGDGGNTTHLTVMDRAGNTIAMTQAINSILGQDMPTRLNQANAHCRPNHQRSSCGMARR